MAARHASARQRSSYAWIASRCVPVREQPEMATAVAVAAMAVEVRPRAMDDL